MREAPGIGAPDGGTKFPPTPTSRRELIARALHELDLSSNLGRVGVAYCQLSNPLLLLRVQFPKQPGPLNSLRAKQTLKHQA